MQHKSVLPRAHNARLFLLLLSFFFSGIKNNVFAQTNWTGSLGISWNDPSNWSAGVPDATDVVTIPNVANKPTISTAALAKNIVINSGSSLTITLSGSLTVNIGNYTGSGILNGGTLNNGGTITIGNTSAGGHYGIENTLTINNQGTINVDRADFAIYSTATVINEGTINIGSSADIGISGVYCIGNFGMFNNKVGGVIKIDRLASLGNGGDGIFGSGSVTFFNQGTITIGALVRGGADGIRCSGAFTNQPGGIIIIDRCTNGIELSSSEFTNQGNITIGSLVPTTTLMEGSGAGYMNNATGGTIKGTGTLTPLVNNIGGILAPGYSPGKMTFTGDETFGAGTVAIEVNGNGTAGVNYDQVDVNGKATLGGTLALTINYAGANGHNIPIIVADSAVGNFASVTGLLPNWYVSYTVTGVSLVYCTSSFLFYPVTGGGLYNCAAAGLPVGVSDSQTGVTYQLKKNGVNMGVPVAGTGSAISFGNQTKGTYTVVATVVIGGCTATMPGKAVNVENCPNAALNFDGSDDYVSLPNTLATAMTADTALTIEYWYRGNTLTSAVRVQTGANYIISGFNGMHIISTDGGAAGVSAGPAVADSNWHHLAMTWQKNTVNGFKSYLDGVLVQQRNSANANLPVLSSGLTLGSNNGTSEFLQGSLDEVRIWKRARTACEIQDFWKCELGANQTGLLAHYKFNQGIVGENNSAVTTLADSSGNNYHGTLTNFALTGTTSTWIIPGGVTIGNTCASTWLGLSSNWGSASNWSTGAVPGDCSRVIINTGVPFSPIVSGTTNSCYNVKLNNGAVINIAVGGKLNVTGK